ncbi:MAG: acyl-CoA dehydrogenase [Campylobacterales bacterium]|nr:acyl-CoA dehydrogenase [Campylobacterales bacterium]
MQFMIIALSIGVLALWYVGAKGVYWAALLALIIYLGAEPGFLFWLLYIPLNIVLLLPSIRRELITRHLVTLIQRLHLMPSISKTEKIALRAGTVWVDGEFFSGKPDFDKIFAQSYPALSQEEQAFLDNEVERVCEMTDDWTVYRERDLSKEVWQYLKEQKFFGMIIPKSYGGLGFSALGHSAVIQKMASRSQVLAITTMVPNSLGPAELILHYGSQTQKEHYLPRLAEGKEIPCFALTEPLAGSDATSIRSSGELFEDEKGEIKIRLQFEKRYITLGSVATLIGLAFVLRDPKKILGRGEELGICCALVAAKTKGIVQGRQHDPLGVPFINSPISGTDVIIGIEDIIGAEEGVGEGWMMLMESLSVGRGISLPSTSTGGMKLAARVAGAYAQVREQFGISIAKFEGIEIELAKIAAFTYMMDAARKFTIGAIDEGGKPAVINAVMKYHSTEKFREVINHAMDIQGGAAISLGPKNLLANAYFGAPVAITVEGANIMTRTLIQFGQGLIRCHPYVYKEIEALEEQDIEAFDENFFKHIGFTLRNMVRMLLLSLTRGYLHFSKRSSLVSKYERKLVWSSASFAFLSDFVMGYYGGSLKQKEKITARFGDVLSWMYLLTATLKRFQAEGEREEDRIYVAWIGEYALHQIQTAYEEISNNIDRSLVGLFFAYPVGWYMRLNSLSKAPSDAFSKALAEKLVSEGRERENLTEGIYLPKNTQEALGRLEHAFRLSCQADLVAAKVKKALRSKVLQKGERLYADALASGVIDEAEYALLCEAKKVREEAIMVDAFSLSDYLKRA